MLLNQELVEQIYDVALGESTWQEVVVKLKKEFNSLITFMMILKPKQAPVIISTNSSDHSLWKSYENHFYKIDPINGWLFSGEMEVNTCHYDPTFFKLHGFYNTEYYNDFCKPHGLYHTGGGLFVTRNNLSIVLAFPRQETAGPYGFYHAQLMSFYASQIIRAIELEGIFGTSLPKQVYEQSLGASYGLSPAESRLILELFKHGSLPEASNSLNRSYHTVRNQMKSILSKTETSNQLELFNLLVNPSH